VAPEIRYAKSGDVHIAYQVFGAGSLDLVYIPGFISNIETYWEWPEFAGWLHLPWLGNNAAQIADMILDFMADPSTATLSPTESQRRLATILFTDIVGSTDRARLSGDTAWRELLAAHDTTVRREIERFRGREVKTLGDGFLAVFDGPARAIRCARAITEAMEPLGIQVRAGLHTGEVEQSESDIQGIAVHLAARIIGEAAAGEVVVSRTVRDLVAGCDVRLSSVHRNGRAHLLRFEQSRNVATSRFVRGQNSKGGQSWRPTNRTTLRASNSW
jgi:class 3 adenylate cyclase